MAAQGTKRDLVVSAAIGMSTKDSFRTIPWEVKSRVATDKSQQSRPMERKPESPRLALPLQAMLVLKRMR